MKPWYFLLVIMLSACKTGTYIDNLNVEELETPCDCVNALSIVLNETLKFIEDNGDSVQNLDSAQQDHLQSYYIDKLTEIKENCQNKELINMDEVALCHNFMLVVQKEKRFKKHWEEFDEIRKQRNL